MHTAILPTYMQVYHMHVWCPWKPEEGTGSLRAGVIASCEMVMSCPNSSPPEKQRAHLTTKPPLQSPQTS